MNEPDRVDGLADSLGVRVLELGEPGQVRRTRLIGHIWSVLGHETRAEDPGGKDEVDLVHRVPSPAWLATMVPTTMMSHVFDLLCSALDLEEDLLAVRGGHLRDTEGTVSSRSSKLTRTRDRP